MKHKLIIGFEHLMTGVQLRSEKGDLLTFERESPSMVRVLSDSPIESYWPAKQAWITSEELAAELEAEKYSEGEIEWYAQKVCPELVALDSVANQQYRNHNVRFYGEDMKDLPPAVIKAMRRKHGAEANLYIRELKPYGSYWGYEIHGMFLGVEPDGYIHS